MREILFRGRRIDNGQWAEGAFLNDRDGAFYICPAVTDITYGDNGNRRRIGCWYKVDPATVGQYTGLADNDGKRIFEGDIIKDDWGKIYKVFYSLKSCSFMVECTITPNEFETGNYRIGEAWCDTIRVIGNIHDNAELLEVGNNGIN